MTRIEYLRRQKNHTQRTLAAEIGVASCNISQIEAGFRKAWPSIRESIARVLEVEEADLFDEQGIPLEVNWTLPKREVI